MRTLFCYCGIKYDADLAIENKHIGYCSKSCVDRAYSNKKITKKKFDEEYCIEQKLLREKRRLDRKNRLNEQLRSLGLDPNGMTRKQKIRALNKHKYLNELEIKHDNNSDNKSFLKSRAWLALRFKALTKYGRKCMCCGAAPPKVILHVDHVKPRFFYPQLALDINNLQVLCELCNLGKGAKYFDDFRENKIVTKE